MTTYADPGARPPRSRRPVDAPPEPPRRSPPGKRAPRGDEPDGPKPPKKSGDPLWAKLCMIIGSVVMVVSGAVVIIPKVVASWATAGITEVPILPPEAPKTIDGPINLLLLGMDQRTGVEAEDAIRADSIMIVHIPATHDKVYLISLPRDAEATIPDFPETDFIGFTTKINASFAAGAQRNGTPDPSPEGRGRGAKLTMMTINKLVPGGIPFNGAAVVNYDGFLSVLEVIGGVEMCVDEEVYSIHYYRDGRKVPPGYFDLDDGVGYHYPVGCRAMEPWEALDFARQRHLSDGDYGRQRHQQQLIKAIIKKMTTMGVLTDLGKLLDLQKAAGDLLTLDLGPVSPEEWIYTLRLLGSDDLVMIKTNGGKFNSAGDGNEQLSAESLSLLQAVSGDTVMDFLTQHPEWVAPDQ
jgi:anionic cell wall polymer biosynthesis LytR-Cps2A-Psr (LCP) family protein